MNIFVIVGWIIIAIFWIINDIVKGNDYIQGIVWAMLIIVLCLEAVKLQEETKK